MIRSTVFSQSEGLVEPRLKAGTLGTFIDDYIASRSDVTDRRLGKLRNAKVRMIEFFGDVKLDSRYGRSRGRLRPMAPEATRPRDGAEGMPNRRPVLPVRLP
jgi:hypothetical protein